MEDSQTEFWKVRSLRLRVSYGMGRESSEAPKTG
jgi:hypothetical protein